METKTVTSKQFTLKVRDFLKGALIAVAAAVISVLYESVSAGNLEFSLDSIKLAAVTAFVGYLSKNFFEPTKKVTIEKE